MVKFLPGDTRVWASCSGGRPAAGPLGPATVASSDTFMAKLIAASACFSFSRNTVSNSSFLGALKVLFSARRMRESSFCSTANNGFATALTSLSARVLAVLTCSAISTNAGRRSGIFFSSSPCLEAKSGKLVSIPSKKSFS